MLLHAERSKLNGIEFIKQEMLYIAEFTINDHANWDN